MSGSGGFGPLIGACLLSVSSLPFASIDRDGLAMKGGLTYKEILLQSGFEAFFVLVRRDLDVSGVKQHRGLSRRCSSEKSGNSTHNGHFPSPIQRHLPTALEAFKEVIAADSVYQPRHKLRSGSIQSDKERVVHDRLRREESRVEGESFG